MPSLPERAHMHPIHFNLFVFRDDRPLQAHTTATCPYNPQNSVAIIELVS